MKTSTANMRIVEGSDSRRIRPVELLSGGEGVSIVDAQHCVCLLPRASADRHKAFEVQPSNASTARLPAASTAPSFDPFFAPAITASPEEIRYAQELRRQLEQRYLSQPTPAVSFWCVGVD